MKVYDMYLSIKETPKWNEGTENILHVFDELLDHMKIHMPDEYDKIEEQLYVAVNGYHFNEKTLEKMCKYMVNDNGTPAPKWKVEDTTPIARSMGIMFDKFNEYDWNYTMNMLYSDYCDVLGDNASAYAKMAVKFLNDKDGPDGKAMRYALCMEKKY